MRRGALLTIVLFGLCLCVPSSAEARWRWCKRIQQATVAVPTVAVQPKTPAPKPAGGVTFFHAGVHNVVIKHIGEVHLHFRVGGDHEVNVHTVLPGKVFVHLLHPEARVVLRIKPPKK